MNANTAENPVGRQPSTAPAAKHSHGFTAQRCLHFAHRLLPVFALIVFAIALFFIHHLLKAHSYREIAGYMNSIPLERRLLAICLTACSYLVLSGYDLMGFRYIGKKVPALKVAFGSFTAFAFSNNIGLANLAGSSIRLRIYSTYGIEPTDTLKIIAFNTVTFWIGFFALAGTMLFISPLQLPASFGISQDWVRVSGATLLAIAISYLAVSILKRTPVVVFGHSFQLPSFGLSVLQLLIAAGDWALAGFVLFILLPQTAEIGYPQFLTIFVSAQVVAMLAHVPGGVGILEALVIYFVAPNHLATPAVLGGLLAYRLIYYILPLITAACFLVTYELYRKRHLVKYATVKRAADAGARRVGQGAVSWTGLIIPSVASLLTFIAGSTMLFSGLMPEMHTRMNVINNWLPLMAIETAHFLSSCIGAALLIVAQALLSRSQAAWLVTFLLLLTGAFLSITRGFEYEEALILIFFAILLFQTRSQFHRRSVLFAEVLSPSWIAAVIMVIGGAIWIGFFAHRHFEYSNDLWWRFALHAGAPRFLRASLGGLGTGLGLAMYYLLRPKRPPQAYLTTNIQEIKSIALASNDTLANLGLVGDKSFILSHRKDAFIMFAKTPKMWFALGDPFGNPESFEDLVYDFKETAAFAGAEIAFYLLESEKIPLYIDLGFCFAVVGEQALVELSRFALSSANSELQESVAHLTSDGFKFELLGVGTASRPDLAPLLQSVSTAWLNAQNPPYQTGFSVAPFSTTYADQFPIAVVRKAQQLIGFATLSVSTSKTQAAINILRYDPAYSDVSDLLITGSIDWAQRQGFSEFILGIAPLAAAPVKASLHLLNEPRSKNEFRKKYEPAMQTRFLGFSEKLDISDVLPSLATLTN